mgnify:CR=1 FL=1
MIKLVVLKLEYKIQFDDYMAELQSFSEKIYPKSIRTLVDMEYTAAIKQLNFDCNMSTLFALDIERNIFVGAVNIRYQLDSLLEHYVGHIGYGVRPSERQKGFCNEILRLAIEICRQNGLYNILMVCDKENIASAKCIIHNGGVFESEVIYKGIVEQRFWITCS